MAELLGVCRGGFQQPFGCDFLEEVRRQVEDTIRSLGCHRFTVLAGKSAVNMEYPLVN